MIIDISEYQQLLDLASAMANDGYQYVVFPEGEISDAGNLTFFKTKWEAAEHSYEMSTDVDYYKSQPVASLINNLGIVEHTGIDTTVNEAFDVVGLADWYRDKTAFLDNNLQRKIMNDKNYDYLKDQVMYTGFGEAMEGELKQNMEQLKPDFKLYHDAFYGNDKVSAELNFRKSEQSDLYFFNSYKVQLQKEGSDESLEQTFYINKGSNVTLKEAYNLMEGRSVHKELTNKEDEKYKTWLQIDFKNTDSNGNFKINHYHENYGFDLEGTLARHTIKELQNPKYKADLISSLNKGNLQSVTFVKDGKETKNYIEANPQFKTITIYDSDLKRQDIRQRNTESMNQSESKEQKQSQKESPASEEEEGETQKKPRRAKKQSL